MSYFNVNLRKLRKAWEHSQGDLAKMFNVSSTTISRWELNTEPSTEVIVAIADYFRISLDLFLKKEMTNAEIPARYQEAPTENAVLASIEDRLKVIEDLIFNNKPHGKPTTQ